MEKKRDILPANHQPLLNARQLATWLNLARSQIYALVAEHKIPCVRIDGSLRFDPRDIDKWLEGLKKEDGSFTVLNNKGWQVRPYKRRA